MTWGEGPSKPKGKGIDPQEWGAVNISQESLDLEAQAAVLKSFKPQSEQEDRARRHRKKSCSLSQHKKQQHHKIKYASGKQQEKHSKYPAEFQSVAQIAPRSYLGAALRNVGHSKGLGFPSDPSSRFWLISVLVLIFI